MSVCEKLGQHPNTSRILSTPRYGILEYRVYLYLDASASKAVRLVHVEHPKPGKIKSKGKVVPVLAMKAYRASRSTAYSYLGSSWR